MRSSIDVKPVRFLMVTFAAIAALLTIHIALVILEHFFGHDSVLGLRSLFHFDIERNVPTFFSATLILLCSGLLALIGYSSDRQGIYWFGLALLFLMLAIDEIHGFHEKLAVLGSDDDPPGMLHFRWAVPYATGALILAVLLARFLKELEPRFRWLFMASGALYVFGAAGIEMISALVVISEGSEGLTYAVVVTIEELTEMSAMAVFGYSLLDYIANYSKGGFSLRVVR